MYLLLYSSILGILMSQFLEIRWNVSKKCHVVAEVKWRFIPGKSSENKKINKLEVRMGFKKLLDVEVWMVFTAGSVS